MPDSNFRPADQEYGSPGRYAGFIEANIEQGPTLEDTANRIGVVTDIVGLRGIRFVFRGQQNHAGTTMMPRRRGCLECPV